MWAGVVWNRVSRAEWRRPRFAESMIMLSDIGRGRSGGFVSLHPVSQGDVISEIGD